MIISRYWQIAIAVGVISCNGSGERSSAESVTSKTDTIVADSNSTTNQPAAARDSSNTFVVDAYPLSENMLSNEGEPTAASMKSGNVISIDKTWFTNDTLKQTILFGMAADEMAAASYHFYNGGVYADMIKSIGFNTDSGKLASESQKLEAFPGFIQQAGKINSTYFTTKKGFRLGDSRKKSIEVYGMPDKQSIIDGTEKLEWAFAGEHSYDGKSDLKGKPIAKDNFGHRVVMYFKDGKLIGQIMYNDIP